MTGIIIAQQHGPTEHPDENVVRRNTFEVNRADPPAEADGPPDMNEVITDPNPKLGMTNRQKASAWTPTVRALPFWAGDATAPHDSIVNDRRASQGFSPAREAEGITGHGTYAFAEGIEPVADLTRAGGMTNEYFAAHRPGVQPTAGDYMTPNSDLIGARMSAAVGATNAREAYQSSAAYGGFLAAMIGG